jgi:serine/threonine protein kinase
MALAAEGMIPVLGGCAGALAGGPEAGMMGGMMGVAVGQAVEKVINFFGARIVDRWAVWFRQQPVEAQQQALAELAATPPEEARQQASALLDELALEPLAAADREVALSYLSLLPGALDRALPRAPGTAARSLPPTMSFDEPVQMLSLLPLTLPPYPVGSEVPGTPYRLEGLLGTGGFGAVYRASTRSLQHLPLAIKFCLDPALAQSLQRERANLERLMKAGGQDWSPRVVRLYGYDLEHKTPYLVYEFVTGGDLIRHVAERRERLGRPLNPTEVLDLITQVTEALAFAHQHGLVHRDLKPANVLVESGVLKLADFGLGGVTAARAAQVSRIGATTVDTLRPAEQASLFRGAGTPLYMSPEQRRGQSPDPRHDLYSLGVMWYQLLVGDVSRELHPGWAKELGLRFAVPRSHINLIEACVGWYDERPKNAAELLRMIREPRDEPAPAPSPAVTNPAAPPTMQPLAAVTQIARPADELRQGLLHSLVKQLHSAHQKVQSLKSWSSVMWHAGVGLVIGMVIMAEGGRTGPGPLPPIIFTALFAGVGWYVRYWRLGTAELEVTETIRTLAMEYPADVQDWGGEAVLRNPEMVAQLAQKLGIVPQPPPPPEAALNALGGEARQSLKAKATRLAELARHAASFARPKPFHLAVAALVGLTVAVGAGFGAAAAFSSYLSPFWRQSGFAPPTYYTSSGRVIQEAEYIALGKQTTVIAALIGVGVGLVVALIVTAWLARRPWYRAQVLGGLLLAATVGTPAGVGSAMLYDYLLSPYYIRHGFNALEYYSAGGGKISEVEYDVLSRRVHTTVAVVGVGVGVAVGLAALLGFQAVYHRRASRARREAEDEAAKLSAEFPQAGGPEALSQPEGVGELLRKLG